MSETIDRYIRCRFCAQTFSASAGAMDADCNRCGHTNHLAARKTAQLTFAYSLTALIFWIPANVFPFMTVELYGNRNSSTIWSGIVALAESGAWAIAAVVFLASLVIPFLKLATLFYLAGTAANGKNTRFKTHLYHVVEAIGRWSMLDIFLLAVLVAIMKLGPWTTVEPELGSLLFALVVVFTMLASASFDPQILWEKKDATPSP